MPGPITLTRPSSRRNWNSSEMKKQEPKTEQTAPPEGAEAAEAAEVPQAAAAGEPVQAPDAGVAAEAAQAPQVQLAPQPGNKDPGGHIWGTGRRKSSVARVRIRPGSGKILVNKRSVEDYFKTERDRQTVRSPLEATKLASSYDVWVNVNGGGITGQADAVKLGLARALIKAAPEAASALRENNLLTRDARMKERKKPGQPGARKRFQFSKR